MKVDKLQSWSGRDGSISAQVHEQGTQSGLGKATLRMYPNSMKESMWGS